MDTAWGSAWAAVNHGKTFSVNNNRREDGPFPQTDGKNMSGGRLPSCSSSTPVRGSQKPAFPTSYSCEKEALSDDDKERFSFLSPIYGGSSNSDEELERSDPQERSPVRSSEARLSPVRCELRRKPSDEIPSGNDEAACSAALSAWELWLVGKAKEDRLNMQKKAQEESMLKERKEQEKMQRERKTFVKEERIQEWLNMKKDREIQNQLARQSKKEEIQKRREKERENEQKAQQKYKNWLKRKNQEKMELETKEKEKAALKEEQERERRKRAEEKFKEWLVKANEKGRESPKTPCSSTNPFDRSNPSPSYFNPIPWKPIHIPPPEKPKEGACGRKPQRRRRCNQSLRAAAGLRASASPGQLQRR